MRPPAPDTAEFAGRRSESGTSWLTAPALHPRRPGSCASQLQQARGHSVEQGEAMIHIYCNGSATGASTPAASFPALEAPLLPGGPHRIRTGRRTVDRPDEPEVGNRKNLAHREVPHDIRSRFGRAARSSAGPENSAFNGTDQPPPERACLLPDDALTSTKSQAVRVAARRFSSGSA